MDGWNEIRSAYECSRYKGASRIKEDVQHVALYTRLAMRRYGWQPMSKSFAVPVKVTLTFVERDKRRDVPNIHGGAKYATDAITARHKDGAGAIYDDSQRWMPEVVYEIAYVGDGFIEPGLQITIEQIGVTK